jgi:dipeptidyl aminopeptidase/acylaminoacyl peptidase
MKRLIFCTTIVFFIVGSLTAQDGKIISKEPLLLPDSIKHRIKSLDAAVANDLQNVNLYRITYLSDGLKIIGFLAEPKEKGKYPCIIANRGGRWNFSLWKPFTFAFYMGRMASWGYVVAASQYRGSADGGEGKEEYGGKDVNDVFNLIPVLSQLTNTDTSRIGMYGESRGGMMTYLALKRSCRFKAAVVVAGIADAFDIIRSRPELEDSTFRKLIPNYSENKDAALQERSAIFWADEMCKTTPLLVMQGSGDRRLDPSQSIRLVEKLYQYKHPVRFILFEGADHTITEFEEEMFLQCKRHFDYYLCEGKPLPNLQPHGQ